MINIDVVCKENVSKLASFPEIIGLALLIHVFLIAVYVSLATITGK
jgi:hypothetical protein